MRYRYLLFSLLLFCVACSGSTPENPSKKIDQLIAQDKYEQALNIVNNLKPDQTKANLDTLKLKTHLNYGIYLEYQGDKGAAMRDRMTGALRQYVEVLKINPDNPKATSEIQQIMGIYSTMPDKSPNQDLIDDLNKLGFNY